MTWEEARVKWIDNTDSGGGTLRCLSRRSRLCALVQIGKTVRPQDSLMTSAAAR